MKIVLTGHQGFIGSALMEYFAEQGLDAIPLDCDVRHKIVFQSTADCMVHLAALTDKKLFKENPIDAYQTNVLGVLNALEFCREKNCRFVFISTCGVYGNSSEKVLKEESPANPVDSYSESKFLAERFCKRYSFEFGVDVNILRLFNVYGPGQGEPFIIPYIVNRMLKKETIELKNPDNVRDFIYIKDICKAIYRTVLPHSGGYNIFNTGCGDPVRIGDIPDIVSNILSIDYKCSFSEKSKSQNGIDYSIADISKAKKLLEWSPEFGISDGLKDMLGKIKL